MTMFQPQQSTYESRYLTFRAVGTLGDYSIIFRSSDIIVYDNNASATIKRLNWSSGS